MFLLLLCFTVVRKIWFFNVNICSLGFGDPWTSKRFRNLQELDNFNLITDRQTEDMGLVELSLRSQNLDDVKENNFILLLQVGIKDKIASIPSQ